VAKRLVNSRQIKIYQKTIDKLRESLGRPIDIYVGSGVPSANWDPFNNEPIDANEELVYSWTIHTIENCLIRWNNKDEFTFTPGGRIETGDCVIKCKLDDVLASGSSVDNDTWFHLAEKVIIDGETCKVMKPPRRTGLRDLYNVEVTLERVDPFG